MRAHPDRARIARRRQGRPPFRGGQVLGPGGVDP
ncbi:hypothetical protein METESE_35270 [Mesoterricola sediminis]|uniref:Uncharacterized protein n=1 Tax=Mesoterricola sediminis TaxID=2927980 RepID=A0AA48GYF0_9BACT|nr:hypothetical protein METESE_35270 [Mesoterricola sediminis]